VVSAAPARSSCEKPRRSRHQRKPDPKLAVASSMDVVMDLGFTRSLIRRSPESLADGCETRAHRIREARRQSAHEGDSKHGVLLSPAYSLRPREAINSLRGNRHYARAPAHPGHATQGTSSSVAAALRPIPSAAKPSAPVGPGRGPQKGRSTRLVPFEANQAGNRVGCGEPPREAAPSGSSRRPVD